MTKEQILGVVRHLLTFFGGILVTKGLIDETIVTEIIGGISTLVGAIWSFIAKTPILTPTETPTETPKVAKKGK